jgi:metal-responsive CopG/Arc/MetJ family transcriptional regulator
MAQDHEPDSETATAMVRLPKTWLRRLDMFAERMSQPGVKVTRSKVIRQAVYLGLIEMEKGKKR